SPRPEVTQCVFVSLRERGTVDHVCIAYLTGGYRLIVHPLSLKKARSLPLTCNIVHKTEQKEQNKAVVVWHFRKSTNFAQQTGNWLI
ncbi:MAG: hypothetical protein PUB53_04665, partial [Bacteroidales bacterium]|nr:hypothetical protein [Bacteroidales bacterium]